MRATWRTLSCAADFQIRATTPHRPLRLSSLQLAARSQFRSLAPLKSSQNVSLSAQRIRRPLCCMLTQRLRILAHHSKKRPLPGHQCPAALTSTRTLHQWRHKVPSSFKCLRQMNQARKMARLACLRPSRNGSTSPTGMA